MTSQGQNRVNHLRQRWAEENFRQSANHVQSNKDDDAEEEYRGISAVTDPEPVSQQQEVQGKQKSWPKHRQPQSVNCFSRTQDEEPENDVVPPVPHGQKSDEETPSPSSGDDADPSPKPESKILTDIYILSYLIFFSILGTLARLGIEAITEYPNAPVTSRVLWANLGGSFLMGFFTEDRRLFKQLHHQHPSINTNEKRPSSTAPESQAQHKKFKKTIPLYIGITTGFCGSFTSFSSFIRDAFLALTNALDSPSPTTPYHSASPIAPRNGGFSLLALLAILILHPAISLVALQVGAQLALLLTPITRPIPTTLLRKYINPLMIPLSLGTWLLATLILSIIPPYDAVNWRTRALLPMLFSPLGCISRHYLSKYLNGINPQFPLGTFTANILATAVLGMCYDLQHASFAPSTVVSPNACAVLNGVMEGFCGTLSTVSTWVTELESLGRRKGWIYGTISVGVGLGLLVCIMGAMGWTVGFMEPSCG